MRIQKLIPLIMIITMISATTQATTYLLRPDAYTVWEGDFAGFSCSPSASCLADDNWGTRMGNSDSLNPLRYAGTTTNISLGAETIINVGIMSSVYSATADTATWINQINISGVTYNGTVRTIETANYVNQSTNYTINPSTSSAWTEDEVNNLVSGGKGLMTQPNGNIFFAEHYVFVETAPPPSVNWNGQTPLDQSTIFGTTIFNYNISSLAPATCTLYIDGTANETTTVAMNDTQTTINYTPDLTTYDTNTYHIGCDGINSTNKTITTDTEPPIIISTIPSPNNTTFVDETLTLNISIQDDTNFDALYNITQNGITQAYNLTQNITAGTFYFTDTIDVSGWNAGVYTIELSAGNV